MYYRHTKDSYENLLAFKLMLEDGLDYHKDKIKEINKFASSSNVDGGMITQELELKGQKVKWYKKRIEDLEYILSAHFDGYGSAYEMYSEEEFKPQDDDTKNYLMDQHQLLRDGENYTSDRIKELDKLAEEQGEIRLLKYHRDQLNSLREWFAWKRGGIHKFLEWHDFDGESWYKNLEKGSIKW